MLDCLKLMEDWDPEGAKMAEGATWLGFAKSAGVDLETLRLALDRVTWDGCYGPISNEEWEDLDGRAMRLKDAKAICKAALEHEPDVRYFHPDVGWECEGVVCCDHPEHAELAHDGPMFHGSEVTIDPEVIKRECFASIVEIYGRLL